MEVEVRLGTMSGRYGGPPAAGGRQIAMPNQTVYINNINDKLPKQQLRRLACLPDEVRCCVAMILEQCSRSPED